MIFLKALAVVLGLAFLLFGYFIYFKKKYNLINGFEADFQDGRKNEAYAASPAYSNYSIFTVLLPIPYSSTGSIAIIHPE